MEKKEFDALMQHNETESNKLAEDFEWFKSNLIGKTLLTAEALCLNKGYFTQLNRKDGETYVYTMEFNPRRIHIDVENDLVTSVNAIG